MYKNFEDAHGSKKNFYSKAKNDQQHHAGSTNRRGEWSTRNKTRKTKNKKKKKNKDHKDQRTRKEEKEQTIIPGITKRGGRRRKKKKKREGRGEWHKRGRKKNPEIKKRKTDL